MTRSLRALTATLLVGLVLALPSVALGQDEEGEAVEPIPITVESGAAVEVPPVDVVEETPPWTQRFLVPTILALTVVVIGGVAVFYLVDIRGRYTVSAE
jgi:hypothetical protein